MCHCLPGQSWPVQIITNQSNHLHHHSTLVMFRSDSTGHLCPKIVHVAPGRDCQDDRGHQRWDRRGHAAVAALDQAAPDAKRPNILRRQGARANT